MVLLLRLQQNTAETDAAEMRRGTVRRVNFIRGLFGTNLMLFIGPSR